MSFLSKLSLGKQSPQTSIRDISVSDAHEGVLAGRFVLIDVRKLDEWSNTGRPQGSHGVTLQDGDFLSQVLAIMNQDKAAAIAFSCKTGGRSSMAADKARDAGHTNISNVKGGFLAWAEAGLPIEKGPF